MRLAGDVIFSACTWIDRYPGLGAVLYIAAISAFLMWYYDCGSIVCGSPQTREEAMHRYRQAEKALVPFQRDLANAANEREREIILRNINSYFLDEDQLELIPPRPDDRSGR